MAQNKVPFNIQKEKGVFFDVQNEFMDRNHASTFVDFLTFDNGPILEMPPSFDQSLQRKSTEKVSNLKIFFKSCLVLVKYKDALEELSTLIEEPHTCPRQQKNNNHIHKRMKIGGEL